MLLGLGKILTFKKASPPKFLYITGAFTTANGVTVNRIAKWDGTNFVSLGTGLNSGTCYALASDNDGNIYVGGNFTNAGGVTANRIAKWNTTSETWSALGTGMNNYVTGITVDSSGNVYAAGLFTNAGGVAANRIAKWNGTGWSALGTGLNNFAYDVTLDSSGNLIVGGVFTTAGGLSANRVAKWNTTSETWSALGAGVNSTVLRVKSDPSSGNVHIVGAFTSTGALLANRYTYWDGTQLAGVSSGAYGIAVGSTRYDLALHPTFGENYMYAVGLPTFGNGYTNLWEGNDAPNPSTNETFETDPHGSMNNTVWCCELDSNDDFYIGGVFTTANGVTVNRVAKWNGSSWVAFGTGLNNLCRRMLLAP
jgi:hypothetical protein